MVEPCPWIRNTWYVACKIEEIADRPLGRTICGERMVFFRSAEGEVAALEDFCPHRGAALSKGFVRGRDLVCGYHGLAVACSGSVVSMPAQHVERFPRVRSFPTAEHYGFIWVWPGDTASADRALLPRFDWAERPDWGYAGGVYHVQADYRLMVDNLMDLTHETYVHANTIGQTEIDETAPDTQLNGDTVVTSRIMQGVTPPPLYEHALRERGLPHDVVDRWQISRFTAPSHVMIDVGVAIAGRGGFDAPDSDKLSSVVVDFITPETATTHWYFWGFASKRETDDPAKVAARRDAQGAVFREDLDVLESQQANLAHNPDRRWLTLNIDAGGVHARRMIARMVADEVPSSAAGPASRLNV